MRLLALCGSLALGEFLAACVPLASECWPFPLCVAIVVTLFGYGLKVSGWPFVAVCALGVALYFAAAKGEIERNRARPWMLDHVTARWQAPSRESVAYKIRCDLSTRIAIGLDERDEAVVLGRAILLGERRAMSKRTKRLFVESGTMHVFAISGLHVMALASVFSSLLAFTFIPRRFNGLFAIPLLWGYVIVIGVPPSAVRAALMATFSLVAPLLWRKPDGLRSWCLTFLLVHLINPLLIVHVGNALSFVVMLAIVLTGEMGANLPKWKQTVLVTFGAWAAGLPIAAHIFGTVTPGSLLGNLVLLTMAKGSVYLGAIGLLSSYLSESLAAHLNNLTALCIHAMVYLAEAVSLLPFSNFETGAWSFVTCIEWYVFLALLSYLVMKIRSRRLAF